MSSRLDQEREKELQPKRMQRAIDLLNDAGYSIDHIDNVKIKFQHRGETITFYPYSGWATGKTIKDGRGIDHLLKQLK